MILYETLKGVSKPSMSLRATVGSVAISLFLMSLRLLRSFHSLAMTLLAQYLKGQFRKSWNSGFSLSLLRVDRDEPR